MFKIEPRYKIKSVGVKELLYRYKFRKYGDKLVYRFPTYKYNGKTLVQGEFIIYEDDFQYIHINSTDINGEYYPCNELPYGKSDVVEIINQTMYEEIQKLVGSGLIIEEEEPNEYGNLW